jgi:hypothetical protein
MPYFPTEHDWMLITRPTKIPMADRFPKVYAVNHLLPHTVYEHHGKSHKTKGKANTNRSNHKNGNNTPLSHQGRVDDPPVEQTASNSQPVEHANTKEMNPQIPI